MRVANSGRGGETSAGALARLVDTTTGWPPDGVVVQFGINDSAVDVSRGESDPRVAGADRLADLEKIVERFRGAAAMLSYREAHVPLG